MRLILDNDIYYEFIDVMDTDPVPVGIAGLKEDRVYEMVITSSNGLWRYRLGDTVRVQSLDPLRISVAGRTKCFINAFGEELMQDNAEKAIGETCGKFGCEISDYTAAPVYASGHRRGRHQWIVEWRKAPADTEAFGAELDAALRRLNSDYDAKRTGTIFLDPPEIISVPAGTFNRWLESRGNHKLGGQKKVPRLSNDRSIADSILKIAGINP